MNLNGVTMVYSTNFAFLASKASAEIGACWKIRTMKISQQRRPQQRH